MANCLLTMAVLLTSNKQTAFPETFFFFFLSRLVVCSLYENRVLDLCAEGQVSYRRVSKGGLRSGGQGV